MLEQNIPSSDGTTTVALLDNLIASYRLEPIDLLGIGDGEGEFRYLQDAYTSYARTLNDIQEIMHARKASKGRVLEIGSYLGVVSTALARRGYEVTAVDIPEFMQNKRLLKRYAQEGVRPLHCNLQYDGIPVDDQSFDLVIMCETLEHLNFNPLPVLTEINRVLNTNGILYLSLPNLASLVNRVKLLRGQSIHNPITDFVAQLATEANMIVGIHWREYAGSEIDELLQLCGFNIQRHYYFTHTRSHPLARLVYRFFHRLRPNQTVIAEKVSDLCQPLACCLGKGCCA